jgi:histidinol-phosphatase (PHP family)
MHVHTRFSSDSKEEPSAAVASAVKKGLSAIALSDHLDLNEKEVGYGYYRYDAAKTEIEALRRRFPEIRLVFAVEVDYGIQWRERVDEWLANHKWDIVIGSVHSLDGRPIENPKLFENASTDELIVQYFRDLNDLVEQDKFDIVAHVDIVKRYLVRYGCKWSRECLINEAGPVIEKIANSGRYLEVNTSGLRQEAGECFPGANLLKAYKNAGGNRLVIGSDAHQAKSVGTGFKQAAGMISRAGFDMETLAGALILLLPA